MTFFGILPTMKSKKMSFNLKWCFLASFIFSGSAQAAPSPLEASIICAKKELTTYGLMAKDFTQLYKNSTHHSLHVDLLQAGEYLYLPGDQGLSAQDFKYSSNHHSYDAHETLLSALQKHSFAAYSVSSSQFQKDVQANGVLVTNAPSFENTTCFYFFTSNQRLPILKENIPLERELIVRVYHQSDLSSQLPDLNDLLAKIAKDPRNFGVEQNPPHPKPEQTDDPESDLKYL
jgi:hypothetical protein